MYRAHAWCLREQTKTCKWMVAPCTRQYAFASAHAEWARLYTCGWCSHWCVCAWRVLVLVGAVLATVHAVVLSGAKAYAQIQFTFNSEASQFMYLCVAPPELYTNVFATRGEWFCLCVFHEDDDGHMQIHTVNWIREEKEEENTKFLFKRQNRRNKYRNTADAVILADLKKNKKIVSSRYQNRTASKYGRACVCVHRIKFQTLAWVETLERCLIISTFLCRYIYGYFFNLLDPVAAFTVFLFVDVFISRHNANYGNNYYYMLMILERAVGKMIRHHIEFVHSLFRNWTCSWFCQRLKKGKNLKWEPRTWITSSNRIEISWS